jgi:hypothetical protein
MIEQLTYAQIAERLGVSSEAARAIVKRHRLPRSRSNDGNKILVTIDLTDIQHTPLARSPRGHEQKVDPVVPLQARIAELEAELEKSSSGHRARVAELEAELARAEQYSRDNRADYERERQRADRIVAAHDRLVDDLQVMRTLEMSALHSLLETADARKEQQPVTAQELAAELETFRFLLQRQPVRTVTTRPRWSLDWLMPWRRPLVEVAR